MSDSQNWKTYPVFVELHAQWKRARGSRIDAPLRPFSRSWESLLADARLLSAEQRREAERDIRLLEKAGLVTLKPPPRRPAQIERVLVPVSAENRIRILFGDRDPAAAWSELGLVLQEYAAKPHPLLASDWSDFCGELQARCRSGRSLRPLAADTPAALRAELELLFNLTARPWPDSTPIRQASIELGLDSKSLESRQTRLEAALSLLFGNATTLEALNIVGQPPLLLVHGPLVVDFSGETWNSDPLSGPFGLSEVDLDRAARICTAARRVLSVENSKTTFHQLAAANRDRATLVIAASAATTPVRLLFSKLEGDFEQFHFGDTDPKGFEILAQLREAAGRRVVPFQMRFRPDPLSPALSSREVALAQSLLEKPILADCHGEISALLSSGLKGQFEQESLGPPRLNSWPFF